MRILYVAARLPAAPMKGDQTRAFHQVRLLAKRHDVTWISFDEGLTDEKSAKVFKEQTNCASVRVISLAPTRFAALLRAPFEEYPLQVLIRWSTAMMRAVQEAVALNQYDLIHVQTLRVARYVEGIRSTPTILDMVDAMSLNLERRSQRDASAVRRMALRFEARRLRDYEQRLVRDFDRVVVVSERDRQALGNTQKVKVCAIGVDVSRFSVGPACATEHRRLVFVGTMDYFPNTEAAIWLGTEIFPRLRRRFPDLQLDLVGPRPTKEIRDLCRFDGIHVTGFVPDVRPYLNRASVAVCPMRSGSGMQFKLIEAMAAKLPVVVSPMGLGGMSGNAGEHYLVADDVEGFVSAIDGLLSDPQRASAMGSRGLELVSSLYSWESSVSVLEGIYSEAAADFRRVSSGSY